MQNQDCLKVSSLLLQFGSSQQIIRSFILKNTHGSMALAYKIKTNNLQALQATPNFGFIRANTAISLRIKAIPQPFQAKLQISYASAGERPGEFNEIWTSLNKNSIKLKQIRVWRSQQVQNPKSSSKLLDVKDHGQRSHSHDKSKRNYMSKMSAQISQSQLAQNIYELQQKLDEQQTCNSKIKQQLQITQNKLKQINQQRLQIKVNKSIGIVCQDYHTSFTTLLLFGLTVFIFGYMLAKWQL